MPPTATIERRVKNHRQDNAIKTLETRLEKLKIKEYETFQTIEKKKLGADTLSESIQLLDGSINNAGNSRKLTVGGWWIFGGTGMTTQEAKEHLEKMKRDRMIIHKQLTILNNEMGEIKSEITKLEKTITTVKNQN